MITKEKLVNGVVYGGIKKEEYSSIRPILKEKNQRMLKLSTVLAAIIMAVLFAVSFVVPSLAKNKFLYLIFLGVMGLLCGLSFVPTKSNTGTLILCYSFLLAVFAFAVILGTFLGNSMPATSFCVFIFALPLLFIDKPYRISIVMIIAVVAFMICSTVSKEQSVASLDRVNGLSFLFLALGVNYFFVKTKLSDVVMHRIIKKERDTDGLTGLLTKVATKREIEKYINEDKKPGAMLVIDIDNFKKVNDTMGHTFGDAVIRMMGNCIKETFRDSDILGRFGGDEFVLFLKEMDNKDLIKSRVEALVSKMNESFTNKDNLYCVTGSIGICVYPDNGVSYDELFAKADEALYDSKNLGKNCYNFYFDKDMAK